MEIVLIKANCFVNWQYHDMNCFNFLKFFELLFIFQLFQNSF